MSNVQASNFPANLFEFIWFCFYFSTRPIYLINWEARVDILRKESELWQLYPFFLGGFWSSQINFNSIEQGFEYLGGLLLICWRATHECSMTVLGYHEEGAKTLLEVGLENVL